MGTGLGSRTGPTMQGVEDHTCFHWQQASLLSYGDGRWEKHPLSDIHYCQTVPTDELGLAT